VSYGIKAITLGFDLMTDDRDKQLKICNGRKIIACHYILA